jgi:signal peptidase I
MAGEKNSIYDHLSILTKILKLRVKLAKMKIFSEMKLPKNKKLSPLAGALVDFFSDVILIFVLVLLIIKPLFFAPFRVQQQSMTPNVLDGEFIIVWKTPYLFGQEYERNDIVVLRPPDSENYLIKRVIGLPGETIRFSDGFILIENAQGEFELLDESFLSAQNYGNTCLENFCNEAAKSETIDLEIPAGEYFVMGDNRLGSRDSRSCFKTGCSDDNQRFLAQDEVEGRAFVVFARFWKEDGSQNFTIKTARFLSDPLQDKLRFFKNLSSCLSPPKHW